MNHKYLITRTDDVPVQKVTVGKVRGGLVKYREHLFYFQSNGNSCLLYNFPGDVGLISRAVHNPGVMQVFLPTNEEVVKFLDNPRPRPVSHTKIPRPSLSLMYWGTEPEGYLNEESSSEEQSS